VAAGVAGCKNVNDLLHDQNEGAWFSKPILTTPDWAKPDVAAKTVELGPRGAVGANELVGADGQCAGGPQMAQAPAPQPAAGSVAGDLASAPMAPAPAGAPDMPQVLGGIALGMTECQAVQRAGTPGSVSIGLGNNRERNVVLTYLSGPWPGIYRFSDGRLKVVERAPTPPEPPKPPPKKKPAKKPVKKPPVQQQ